MLTFSFKNFLLGLRLFGDAALLVVGVCNNFGLELIPNMLSSICNLNDIYVYDLDSGINNIIYLKLLISQLRDINIYQHALTSSHRRIYRTLNSISLYL